MFKKNQIKCGLSCDFRFLLEFRPLTPIHITYLYFLAWKSRLLFRISWALFFFFPFSLWLPGPLGFCYIHFSCLEAPTVESH